MQLEQIPLTAITERLEARTIKPSGVARLADNMRTMGYLPHFPVLVVHLKDGKYRLLDGGHRVDAAQKAGLDEVTGVVRKACANELEEIQVARQANEASGTSIDTTLIDDAEIVWRLGKSYTQEQIGEALGWSREQVKDYAALHKIEEKAWRVIGATFRAVPLEADNAIAPDNGADAPKSSPFTEGLLRNILDLGDRQQLFLCTKLAKTAGGKGYTKKDFREDAQRFTAYNHLWDAMEEGLSVIPEAERARYQDAMIEALYPNKHTEAPRSEYITEWHKEKKPGIKFAKLLQAQLDAYAQETSVRVFCCAIEQLTETDIADASVDVIITDPPYTREAIQLFYTLGQVAERVLKPGGSLVVLCGQSYLPEYITLLEDALTYRWTLACHLPGGQAVQIWQAEVLTFWKPVLWFVKEPFEGQKWVSDHFSTPVNSNDKRFHEWGQSEHCFRELVERFSLQGDTIYDPFLGGGTCGVVAKALERKFVGSDADEETARTAHVRIHEEA